MADTESLRQAIQSRAPFSSWVGIVLLLALFGVIVLAVIGPSPRGDNFERTRAKNREEKLKTLRDADGKELNTYGWVDKNKGVVRVPIARGMELAMSELAAKKPAPAYPIATPAPSAATGGAAVASPAPAPSAQPSASPKPIAVEGPKSESRGQPAAAINPPGAAPGTQPGAGATPAASPQSSAAVAPNASPVAVPSPPGSPLPVRGKTPP
jgi:hypothetical protein